MHDDGSTSGTGVPPDESTTLTQIDDQAVPIQSEVDGEIGAYRILGSLGTGGFAEVFLAEQTRPVRRKVAVKVIKPGLESREILARFAAERQALALMEHPNVAQVFDAGVTDTGRPFFVMEYVDGLPITSYCDRRQLDLDQRLEIFLQACAAVQHAHQKGVIHRDIKPSNVLVMNDDGKHRVKVIDFGIAKAVQDHESDGTPVTRIGQVIGTVEYMSPEQAGGAAEGVDTRTDVYSLGALLYELLTGNLPFDPVRLRGAARMEVRRIICEEDPPRPSARVSELGEASQTVANSHHTDARSLVRELRGDLDWITMKAMEKDRARRYASASELAADIERCRLDQPVVAGPPSASYRLRKFVRRHRFGVAAAGALVLVLVAGIVSTSIFAVGQARARARAQAESERARTVVAFLRDMLSSADPAYAPKDVLVLDVVDRAARRLERDPSVDPEVEAALRTAVGATYLGLTELDKAEIHLERALEIQTRVHGDDHLTVGETLHYLGWLALWRQQLDRAEEMIRRALDIMRRRLPPDDPRLADVLQDLGVVLQQAGKLDEAERALCEALEESRRSPRSSKIETALVMSRLGTVVALGGRYDEAEALQREALAVFRAAGEPMHVRAPEVMSWLSWVLQQTGKLDEAEALSREVIEIKRAEYGDKSPNVAQAMVDLGQIERARGNMAEAEALMRQALEIYISGRGDDDIYTVAVKQHLAVVLDDVGSSDQAAALYPEILAALEAAYGPDNWEVANARNRYGLCLMRLGRYGQAERELLGAYEVLVAAGFQDRARAAAERLADLYQTTGRDDEAAYWRSLSAGP